MWFTRSQLSESEQTGLPAYRASIPDRAVLNGDPTTVLQTRQEKHFEREIVPMADTSSNRPETTRGDHLQSPCGVPDPFWHWRPVFIAAGCFHLFSEKFPEIRKTEDRSVCINCPKSKRAIINHISPPGANFC
jgi:hypothetical protein